MTTFTTRTVSSLRPEWIVPAAEPWGATHAEIAKALVQADRAYREHHGISEEVMIPDDALTFHARDDQVIISFAVETEQPGINL